jgi:hypothetical protein
MPRPAGQTALAMFGEYDRAEAHRRWLVLRAHVEDGVPLTRVAAQSGIPHRTLQRWLARYRAGWPGPGPARRPGSFPHPRAVEAPGREPGVAHAGPVHRKREASRG